MACQIFISYRRADAPNAVGRLYDKLLSKYGSDRVFYDTNMSGGTNLREEIHAQIARSKIFIVVIGKGWLQPGGADNALRLEDPEDFVRREIEEALRLGLYIIPLLVEDAELPDAKMLPASIRPFLDGLAREVRTDSFSRDVDLLIGDIDKRCRPDRMKTKWLMLLALAAVLLFSGDLILSRFNKSQPVSCALVSSFPWCAPAKPDFCLKSKEMRTWSEKRTCDELGL